MEENELACIAFEGSRGIACGPLREVARQVKDVHDARPLARILVFNAQTSETIEIDWRGSVEQVLNRIPALAKDLAPAGELRQPELAAPAGPGRPRRPSTRSTSGTIRCGCCRRTAHPPSGHRPDRALLGLPGSTPPSAPRR